MHARRHERVGTAKSPDLGTLGGCGRRSAVLEDGGLHSQPRPASTVITELVMRLLGVLRE